MLQIYVSLSIYGQKFPCCLIDPPSPTCITSNVFHPNTVCIKKASTSFAICLHPIPCNTKGWNISPSDKWYSHGIINWLDIACWCTLMWDRRNNTLLTIWNGTEVPKAIRGQLVRWRVDNMYVSWVLGLFVLVHIALILILIWWKFLHSSPGYFKAQKHFFIIYFLARLVFTCLPMKCVNFWMNSSTLLSKQWEKVEVSLLIHIKYQQLSYSNFWLLNCWKLPE